MLKSIKNHVLNISGWRTNRKIVVFESDDWGSIRMPSKEVLSVFLDKNIPISTSPYCRFDSLASEEDLTLLFDLLLYFKDRSGNHPIITANTVVANPDFEKIKSSDFQEYYFEPFLETLQKYPQHTNCFALWMKGMEEKVFFPQYHGREHVNVPYWLRALQQGNEVVKFAFDQGCWGLPPSAMSGIPINLQASYDTEFEEDTSFHEASIKVGLRLFNEIFDYPSESFIANNFIWAPRLEKTLSNEGVKYIQGMKYQLFPKGNNKKRIKKRHFLGEKNRFGQYYLIRNCMFEPSQMRFGFDSVSTCLNDIGNAFFWGKPAIITTHRLNFIGFIDKGNRDKNLILFHELLSKIINKWPEVEFMSSCELGAKIAAEFYEKTKH